MKKFKTYYFSALLLVVIMGCSTKEKNVNNDNQKLILSENAASQIEAELADNKLLKTSFNEVKSKADNALENGIEIPIPKDAGGGYTHEKHKENYANMYDAALVYSINEEIKYASFVENMLLQYAKMYQNLDLHPKSKENHPAGKLFWQGLNESVWLFYTIQAYDLVKSNISKENQEIIENQLLRNVAKFLSEDSYDTFNKVHNHGTWSVAAVGMTGYVLNDKDMVERALYGSDKNKKTGFLKQLDKLFSPDGYYSEGPYYQRYAMLPFIVFAEAIENNQPELKIFEYRNQLLKKAVTTLLQLTNEKGFFYPFNDAIKEKDFYSEELVFATNIAFERYKDISFLPVIQAHNKVSLTDAGLAAAIALNNSENKKYNRLPLLIKDGENGEKGGLALLRMASGENGQLNAVFKFASQGMGHGHFDRLSLMVYDEGREVLQDYGAARFLNVEAKQGGQYLPENKTFAKQSIAHNTLIVDEISHFTAKVNEGEKYNSELIFSDLDNDEVQIVSAKENHAYKDVDLKRTLAMINLKEEKSSPFLVDVFQVTSKNKHQYDLNFQYLGQLMDTNFEYDKEKTITALGAKNGYQHLYKLASAKSTKDLARLTFMQENKFYSLSTITENHTELILTRIGANDPNFNLRNDAGYIIRKSNKDKAIFVSIIEPHGGYNAQLETVQNPNSNLENLELTYEDSSYVAVSFQFKNQNKYLLIFPQNTSSKATNHSVKINGETYSWTGNYQLEAYKK